MQACTPFYPITIQGKQFVYATPKDQKRFMVRGVALSTAGVAGLVIDDILADNHAETFATLILPKLIDLNVNLVRVYQIDPTRSHAKSMTLLEEHGIYVMVGLATSAHSIGRMTGSYPLATFLHGAAVVAEFQGYLNTFGFSVGNEVEFPGQQATNIQTANPGYTDQQVVAATIALELTVAQAVKSYARDIKRFLKDQNYRQIPVGVAQQDGPQSSWGSSNPNPWQQGLIGTDTIAQYYAYPDPSDPQGSLDFIGINSYRYVSGLGQASQAYQGLAQEAQALAVPVFLTESGAITNPRTWNDVPTFYDIPNQSCDYGTQLSGEVAFELIEEGNGFGLYDYDQAQADLTPAANGGATQLAQHYQAVCRANLAQTAASPTPSLPTGYNWPSLLPPNIVAPITVTNSSTATVAVVQGGYMFTFLEANTSSQIFACQDQQLLLQGYPGWSACCGVPAGQVKAGITVNNNVVWGDGVACTVTS